ncbi:MAG: tetratricopeptide repeat protein [Sphingobacteriales bacterium]|nr:MAG: tetratricopeptide repeat protein [Sphingobacteriales bacterium]
MDTPHFVALQAAYQTAATEHERIDNLIDQAMEVRNYDVEKAMALADEILTRSQAIGYPLGTGRGFNMKGWCYWRQGYYEEAREVLNQAYNIATEHKNKALEARVLNNFASVYRDLGDLVRGLNYLDMALRLNEKLGDEKAQAVSLASIASIYYDLADYENALDFAQRALPAFEAARDVHRLGSLNYILGNIYFKQGAYSNALQHFQQNATMADPGTIAHALALSGLGKVYFKMGVSGPAEEYLANALKIGEEMGDVEVPITCFYYQGCIEMQTGHYRQASAQFSKAMEVAEDSQRRPDMMSIHETCASLYEEMGNLPQAYYHLKSYEQLKEEIFRQTAFNKLRNLQARQELELARKELEVAEQTALLKQQFMANMSHEIRTPMNAIVGMTRLLLEKNPAPDQLKYLSAIRQSADNLLVIINDILDFSKLEAGKITLEEISFSVTDTVRDVREMLLLKADEKKLDFRIETAPNLPQWVMGDPTRLTQILVNLAGNAIKFTDHGAVTLRVQVLDSKDAQYRLCFEVIDTGIGIPEAYVSQIFESFTQAGSDTARRFGGTGLGLTITKQLVELMKGQVSVQSAEGNGTTFRVELPFRNVPAPEQRVAAVDAETVLPAFLSTLRILLVEDNAFNQMVAQDTLQTLLPDAEVDIAENGQLGVDALRQKAYDLILMDVQMPVMDGVTATRMIRKELPQPACSTPIIAMTANVLREDVDTYLSAGMNAYVPKPFRPEDLKRAILLALPDASHLRGTVIKLPDVVEPVLPSLVTDLTFLNGFANGNDEKITKYIRMFLSNAPRLLAEIRTGIATGDLKAVQIAAHSLKPQLSYMGVKEEISNIFLMEQTAGGAGISGTLPALLQNLQRVCEKAFQELNRNL